MILDALLQFSANQSLALAVGSYDSTNTIDFGINGLPSSAAGGGARDMGIGDDPSLKLNVVLTTGITSGGAATLAVTISGAPDNGAGAPGTFVPWYTTNALALANLAQGASLFEIDFPRPPQGAPVPRFVKLTYVIAGATITAGAVNSTIVLDRDDPMYNGNSNVYYGGYPAGVVINN